MSEALPFAGQTQNALLHVLLRSGVALSVDTIAAELGVTKTAARQHVLSLQQAGYVHISDQESQRQVQRGRRAYTYEISAEGRELFTRQYALFSQKMISLMQNMLDEKAFKKQMQEMGKSLASDLAHHMPKPKRGKTPDTGTLKQLAALMRTLGYDARQDADDEIIAYNCVFHQLAESCESVCEVDLTLMQKLTGKKPEHKQCLVRGDNVCRFKF